MTKSCVPAAKTYAFLLDDNDECKKPRAQRNA